MAVAGAHALGRGEPRVPVSSLDGCSQAFLLARSRTLGAQGGRSTRTWWTRTPPPSTLPGARRVRRTPSSLSRKQRAYGTSLRDPQPRSERPLKGAGRRALLCQLPGAWAEGTQHCARKPAVSSLSSVPLRHACPVEAVSRSLCCGDPAQVPRRMTTCLRWPCPWPHRQATSSCPESLGRARQGCAGAQQSPWLQCTHFWRN